MRQHFGNSAEFAATSKVLVANKGLYKAFLAAGLIWGPNLGPAWPAVQLFFLGCVIIAGVYGAVTVGVKILFVQALLAALSAATVWRHT